MLLGAGPGLNVDLAALSFQVPAIPFGIWAKAVDANAEALSAEDVLIAGTARGGEVLGQPVGRIAPDHAADLVVLDLQSLSLLPAATAPKQVVYAMQPEAIARVYVGGEVVAERGVPTGVDVPALRAKVAEVTKGWEPLA